MKMENVEKKRVGGIKMHKIENNRIYTSCAYKRLFFMMPFVLCFMLLFAGVDVASAQTLTHPCLLFKNIEDTPGYQHRTESPWSSWEVGIIFAADSALTKNFSDPQWSMFSQARAARDLGLAYQITDNTTYAMKAKEALLVLDIGNAPYDVSNAWGLIGYSLAYDWVQPYLDPTSDESIRDKLATLTDQAYYDLNDGGTNMHYIAFADYHGQTYPVMGIVGCVLSDYTNPNGLPISSTPSDWMKAGTDYLFVNDDLHDWNRSLISFGCDYLGTNFQGAYKAYVLDEFLWWFQVYSHFTGENIFDVYPVAKDMMMTELRESMPNRYYANRITGGNTKWYFHGGIMNLLDNDSKAYMLNYYDIITDSDLLPYSSSSAGGEADTRLQYLVRDDYEGIQRKNPSWTSDLDSDSQLQIFRKNWNNDSDWLTLMTWYLATSSNREMAHHDQLSIEYYSKGDLLLADGGETKHTLDRIYGMYGFYHNTILIEDPRSPFDVSSAVDSRARGIFKGLNGALITPAYIGNLIETPWIELSEANCFIGAVPEHKFSGAVWYSSKNPLSSLIEYERTVLYPDDDYFIIIDRLEGSEPWIYRNVFRPTSLNITPSTGRTEAEVGHVNGDLVIGGNSYDWLSLPYKTEQTPGIKTSSVKWNTTNLYGDDVELHLFSSPSSEIKVTKHVTRIAGYSLESEVFLPLVYFRTNETNDLYRITTLLSRYSTETEKTPEEIPVTGNGNAIKVTSGTVTDYIYAGSGESSFGVLTTDADTLHLRKTAQPTEYTFINGSYVIYSAASLVEVSNKVDYLSLKQEGENRTFTIKGEGTDVDIALYQMNPSITYQVKKDGAVYSNWVMIDGNTKMVITTDLSEHTFEIEALVGATGAISGTVTDTSTNPIQGVTVSDGTRSDTTLADGTYTISNVPVGTYTLTCTATGYEDGSQANVVVSEGETTTVDFVLSALAPPNHPPEMTSATITPDPAYANTDLTATGEATDADNDPITFSYQWKKNTIELSGEINQTLSITNFVKEDSITVVIIPNDGKEDGNPLESLALTISNSAPVLAVIGDISVNEGETVSFNPSAGDADEDTLSYSYSGWMTTSSYVTDYDDAGVHTVTVTVSDGEESDSQDVTVTVNNVNRAPVAEDQSVPMDEDTAKAITLAAADADGDSLIYTIVTVPANGTLSGSTPAVSYRPNENYNGSDSWTFKANDGTEDSNIATVSITITPVNDAPVLDPIGNKSVDEGATLTFAVSASDLDEDTVTITASGLKDWMSFDATTFSATPDYGDSGNYQITFTTTDDGTPSLSDTETITITVGNVNRLPEMLSAEISPSIAYTNTNLTAQGTATDADKDTVTFKYQWQKNGSNIIGKTGSILSGSYFVKGNSISVIITPYDGKDYGKSLKSNNLVISNSSPTAPLVGIRPINPKADEDLVCEIIKASEDLDKDSIVYKYAWYKNDVLQEALLSDTVSSSYTSGGEIWGCVVTPNDGEVDGEIGKGECYLEGVLRTFEVELDAGWNLISLPLKPVTPYKAQDLCDEINSQGGNVVEIDRWYNGTWQGHINLLPFNNFDIKVREGYFVKCLSAGTWTQTESPLGFLETFLHTDWNLISIPCRDYKAKDVCDGVSYQGGGILEIQRWRNGTWDGYVDLLPFNNFDIEQGKAYFVNCTKALTWRVGDLLIETSEIAGSSFIVSWVSEAAEIGWINYGAEPNKLNKTIYDNGGKYICDTIHCVVISGLIPNTTYYYDVVSGGITYDNDGKHFTCTTLSVQICAGEGE